MTTHDTATTFTELLACPRCDHTPLGKTDRGLACKACKTTFPEISGIPWLFAEPEAALGEWRNRLQFALKSLAYESQRINKELNSTELMTSTRRRLEQHVAANDEHRALLGALLAPLDVQSLQANYESHLALRTRLPSDQGLSTYYSNVHRDWVWGDAENAASIKEIATALQENGSEHLGDVLVLGAGAGRLAYDLHEQMPSGRTVAIDFNPLLLLIAQRMAAGEKLELYEFPIAPLGTDATAIKQTLAAPTAAREGLDFALADALRPPFAAGSVDTVVTPWLIDIISEDLRTLARRVNRLLKPGGRWINFGSLAFGNADRALRYGPDEVVEIVSNSGFGEVTVRDGTIPYMSSPHSRHGREETVFTFIASKAGDAEQPERHKALPDWIVVGKEPVPLTQSFAAQATSTRVYAFVMSLIDGQRSIEDMAVIFEQQKLMSKDEAVPAIRSFLTRMFEDSQRNPNF